jgi:hypothetical protein
VIAFPFYKGIAEAMLHEIVILLAACLFRATPVMLFTPRTIAV